MDVLLTISLYVLVAIIVAWILLAIAKALGIGEPWRTIIMGVIALAVVVVVARTLGIF